MVQNTALTTIHMLIIYVAADVVTQVDRQVEAFISGRLSTRYPDHLFVGEETYKSGITIITDQPTFIVDPIDGTANFVHGHPEVCISIGFTVNRKPAVGVVFNPYRSELWSAATGHGAHYRVGDSQRKLPLNVPTLSLHGLKSACIGLEWSSDRSGPNFDLNAHVVTTLASSDAEKGGRFAHAIRFHGSAAQTICRVAAGQQDAFWQCGCWAWDVAAAWCILIEAGGMMVDGHPGGWEPPVDNRRYLAVRSASHQEQRDFVREFWSVLGDKRSTHGPDIVTTKQRPLYPPGVPIKFSPQGAPALYEGNTTVCHIHPASPILPKLQNIYNALRTHPTLSSLMYLVPPSSWHVTILGGVRDKIRSDGTWPLGKENLTLEECTQDFARKLRDFGLRLPDLGLGPPYHVRMSGYDADNGTGIGVIVVGATTAEDQRLRRLRNVFADMLFGFPAPDRDSWVFHITICYFLRHIDGVNNTELKKTLGSVLNMAQGDFELGAVEFCTFRDMLFFDKMFYLGEKEIKA